MAMHRAGATVIKPTARQKGLRTVALLVACGCFAYTASDLRGEPASWKAADIAFFGALFLLGCLSWRELMRLDHQGVLVRNHFRSYRLGWSEISHMADGASRKGNWELNLVLASGRVVRARATNWSTKAADPDVLTALSESAGWHGTPAALTGIAIEHGLYADPGGQRGVRYWSGTWSPLLPAEAFAGKKIPEFPARVECELPAEDGSWTYAAAQARKMTGWFAGLATLAGLTLTAAIVIDPSYYSPLRWLVQPLTNVRFGVLFVAAVFAWLASLVWIARMQMSKLERAAKTGATVTGPADTSVVDEPYTSQ